VFVLLKLDEMHVVSALIANKNISRARNSTRHRIFYTNFSLIRSVAYFPDSREEVLTIKIRLIYLRPSLHPYQWDCFSSFSLLKLLNSSLGPNESDILLSLDKLQSSSSMAQSK
jgi:hypothetical protein